MVKMLMICQQRIAMIFRPKWQFYFLFFRNFFLGGGRPETTNLPFNHFYDFLWYHAINEIQNIGVPFRKVISQLGHVFLQKKKIFKKNFEIFFENIFFVWNKNNNQLTDYPQSFLKGAPKSCAHLACSFSSLALFFDF